MIPDTPARSAWSAPREHNANDGPVDDELVEEGLPMNFGGDETFAPGSRL